MRYLIKGGKRMQLLPLPTVEDELKSCPTCHCLFDTVKIRRAAYVPCKHIFCLGCMFKSKVGCGKCSKAETTPSPSSSVICIEHIRSPQQQSPSISLASRQQQPLLINLEDGEEEEAMQENEENEQEPQQISEMSSGEEEIKPNFSFVASPYRCTHCDSSFANRQSLGVHLRTDHKKQRAHTCDICKWPFETEEHLLYHRQTHSNDRSYKCKVCDSGFPTQYTLSRHVKRVHGVKAFNSMMTIGPVKVSKMEEVKTEVRENLVVPRKPEKNVKEEANYSIPSKETPVISKPSTSAARASQPPSGMLHLCPTCGKPFSLKRNLGVHIRLAHGNLYPFICELCKYPFRKLANMRAHHRRAHNRVYKCVECGSNHNQKSSLENHMTIMHPNWDNDKKGIIRREKSGLIGGSIQCDLCDTTFQHKSSKITHMFKCHSVKIRLSAEERGRENERHCPECQTPFSEEEGPHKKVGFAFCTHFCCLTCVIRDVESGCGQCTTEVAPKTRLPSMSPSPLKSRSVVPDNMSPHVLIKPLKLDIKKEEPEEPAAVPLRRSRRLSMSPNNGLSDSPEIPLTPLIQQGSQSPSTPTRNLRPRTPLLKIVIKSEVPTETPEEEIKKKRASDGEKRKKKKSLKVEWEEMKKRLEEERLRKKNTWKEKRTCYFCQAIFPKIKLLEIHVQKAHADGECVCHVCKMPFNNNYNLKRHMRVHSGAKPFSCPLCQLRFARVDTLKDHITKLHGSSSYKKVKKINALRRGKPGPKVKVQVNTKMRGVGRPKKNGRQLK